MAKPTAERIMLTPELAQYLLDHNYGSEKHLAHLEFHDIKGGIRQNRHLSMARSQEIARIIAHKHWKFTFDAIRIGKSGYMIDGQHRTMGVTIAKRPIDTIVAYGLDDVVIESIDRTRPRSYSDTLKIRGKGKNAGRMSGIASCIYSIEHDFWSGKGNIGPSDLDEIVGEHGEGIDWVLGAIPKKIQNPTTTAAAREISGPWAYMYPINPEKMTAMASKYVSGERLTKADPMKALRQLLGEGGVFSRKGVKSLERTARVMRCLECGIKDIPYAVSKKENDANVIARVREWREGVK